MNSPLAGTQYVPVQSLYRPPSSVDIVPLWWIRVVPQQPRLTDSSFVCSVIYTCNSKHSKIKFGIKSWTYCIFVMFCTASRSHNCWLTAACSADVSTTVYSPPTPTPWKTIDNPWGSSMGFSIHVGDQSLTAKISFTSILYKPLEYQYYSYFEPEFQSLVLI